MKGIAELWLRLYEILKARIIRLRKGEGARRIALTRSVMRRAKEILDHEGIPYVVRKDGIYVLEEDYWDAIKALTRWT